VRRCLLAFDAPDGGVAEHVFRLATGLGERGWQPWVAGPESAVVYAGLEAAGVPIVRLPVRPGYAHPIDDVRALRRLSELLRQRRFDLVNTHSPKAGVLARLAAFAGGVPSVATAHGFAFNPAIRGPAGRAFSLLVEQLLAPRTQAFICVSHAVRQLAIDHRLAPPTALHTVHNGAPACEPRPDAVTELERFSREGPLAGCVTVLRPGKGVETFLAAAPRVLEQVPSARLAVIGNGTLSARLQSDAKALGLDGRLRFFPYAPPSARQLRSLDVFVLPSPWEAFPIASLEALACGVPQVATNVGGIPEAVREGTTGLLCPPGDPDRLAQCVVRLLSDSDLRARMSRASRERHRRRFTVERMLDETAAVFDRVAAISSG
jgi:glycosyltransferase involved in cell wall biosynthesis